MAKRIVIGLILFLVGIGIIWAVDYLAIFDFGLSTRLSGSNTSSEIPRNTFTTPTAETSSTESVPYTVEVVAENLDVPWSIVFTGSNRMLVSQRPGTIVEVIDGAVTAQPLISFSETATGGEIGLMGMTKDPDYESNSLLYACVGYRTANGFADKVLQLRDQGSSIEEVTTVIDGIPAGSNHAGCELAFGPDGKLYISTGDATERNIAQDLNSLGGKILRINSDGSFPENNPFENSAIYSYGHRNPQGLDWTTDGTLYEAEHGPSGNDGPGGGDEINLISAGENYGWPLVSHQETREGTVAPLITYTPAEAPSSLLVYKGDVFPQFKDTVLFAALRGNGVFLVQFDANDPSKVISSEQIEEISVGRVREITEGPDGLIYFTSSNTDGRGRPSSTDDTIYRLAPAER